MKKNFLIFFFSLFILVLIINFFPSIYFKKVGFFIRQNLPEVISKNLFIIFDNKINLKRSSNDYNVVFLPKTQYLDLNYKKHKINFIEKKEVGYLAEKKFPFKSFFIEVFEDQLFLVDRSGNINFFKTEDLLTKKLNFKQIKTNFISLKNYYQESILDFEIYKKKIFLSRVVRTDKNCFYLSIDVADLNYDLLIFKNIFISNQNINNECIKGIQGGKIEIFDDNNLLVTTAADILKEKDESDSKPQNDNSLFGKILKINFVNNNYSIFNKGHRNSLGLLVEEGFILSTENGPRGGDEINLELEEKNYGWDIASFGQKYKFDYNYLDHESNNYQEPIFSFIPSLALSEIIKLGDNFSEKWKDNYLIGSLYGGQLLRVRFNSKKTKVVYLEKIFIGERIRDIVYDEKTKSIILALETSGSLGVLSVN